MTVNSTTNRVSYAGNGTANPLAVAFPFLAAADLKVLAVIAATGVQTVMVLNSDYTVTGTPDANGFYTSGGNVVPAANVAVGTNWVIYRDPALTQLVQHVDNDPLPAESIDSPVDKLTMVAQRLSERLDRSLVAPDGDPAASLVLPAKPARLGKLLGFDAVTGLPSVAVADAAAIEAAAAQSAQAVIDFQTLIATYGAPIATYKNILDLFTPAEIAIIKAGDNSTDLTTKVSNGMAAFPGIGWFWPAGTYFLNNTLTLPSGVNAPRWVGAGPGVTIVKTGGSPWGIQQLNPNGTTAVRGFSAEDITFRISHSGIRLNSITGGFDDTSGTQYYITAPVFEHCEFIYNGTPASDILLQFNKCFNGGVNKSKFSGGAVQVNFEGSDICWITHNRMDNATDGAVLVNSHGTFGSTSKVTHNDINNPKNFFYWGCDRDGIITHNHMELDFSPGSSGTAGNMVSAINITAGNAFKTTIQNNRIEGEQFMDNWLKYASANPYSLIAEGNGSTGPGTAGVNIGSLPYFTNSGTRTVCIHRGNLFASENGGWPMNTMPGDVYAGTVRGALLSAGRPGVSNAVGLGVIAGGVKCQSGDFKMAADANTGHYIEFSDWTGWPANTLKGTFAINIVHYGDVNGQVMSWAILDGAGAVASGTVTNTTANVLYVDNVLTSTAFSTKFVLRVWNADTVRNGNCFVRAVEVLLG